jgi:glycosyltransferase involved in cell wall biosynthesis
MRVLFLSQIVPYPPHGGVLQRGYNILRELGNLAEVHLLAFIHPEALPTPDTLAESREALGRFCRTVEYFPLWVKKSPLHKAAGLGLSLFSREPFGAIAHRSRAFSQRVAAAAGANRFDVVHVDTIGLSGFVDLEHPPAATVLTHHNIESMLMARRSQVQPGVAARAFLAREAAKLQNAERRIPPRFDLNIVMSESDGRALAELAPAARAAVVPNGVDTNYFTPALNRETPALIYGGGMNMFANRDAVMYFITEVWPSIQAVRPDVRFFAVGQDPPRELLALAERDSRIVVTGYVTDIREYIGQAAVYVVPLRVGGGTRLKVLDALAMGKAMVSTSTGCEGINVTPGEHLQIGDTPQAFAEATLALLGDPQRRQALGQAARALVEREYAWPVVGRQLVDSYHEAIRVRASKS